MSTEKNNESEKDAIKILEETENAEASNLEDNEIIGNDGETVTLDKD